jgi:hypothetical protein
MDDHSGWEVSPVERDGSKRSLLSEVVMAENDHHLGMMRAEWFGHIGRNSFHVGVSFTRFLGELRMYCTGGEAVLTSMRILFESSLFHEP